MPDWLLAADKPAFRLRLPRRRLPSDYQIAVALVVLFLAYWCQLRCDFSPALTNRVKRQVESV